MSLPADPLLIAEDTSLIQAPGEPAPADQDVVVRGRLFVAAFLGPTVYEAITGWNYSGQDFTAFLQPPSAQHWFGTTQIGGDVFAQTMRGLQKSLLIGLLVASISTGLAAIVGAVAGYFGGWTDRVLMWI